MNNDRRIICLIPARGGSKGLKRKNIKLFGGEPLIAHTIKAAINSKLIDNIYVSTEDEEISQISKNYGALVSKRPKELAKDETKTIEVLLDFLNNLNFDKDKLIIILLQPTSPLRTTQDIDDSINVFLEGKCESVISVCKINHSPLWSFKFEEGYLKPFFKQEYLEQRRQELPILYAPNGAIYISTPKTLNEYLSFFGNKTIPYIMPFERSIDIDSEEDFNLAEIIFKYMLTQK
ncbi:MAG TPA: acylneuraminate cytidylyltransferase family protein [Methanofastidiosum sp.]|jgi:CMP-N-acetylneuraminic acid synthetase|nr:acylneuraminate cytidylyltransferase family protein [Methanofastidiosum sp.]HOR87622.1 acylneuraminate cytidylyltransferase family protein [Methanofastidiosum sp.]HPL01068.1 acylneuraminate cytidylyltransferase family protein [Methanofastidiosum sp.]